MQEQFVQKKGRCKRCIYRKSVIIDGIECMGCYYAPYNGELINEIKKCPRILERKGIKP